MINFNRRFGPIARDEDVHFRSGKLEYEIMRVAAFIEELMKRSLSTLLCDSCTQTRSAINVLGSDTRKGGEKKKEGNRIYIEII